MCAKTLKSPEINRCAAAVISVLHYQLNLRSVLLKDICICWGHLEEGAEVGYVANTYHIFLTNDEQMTLRSEHAFWITRKMCAWRGFLIPLSTMLLLTRLA
jgi:hypothetical protein